MSPSTPSTPLTPSTSWVNPLFEHRNLEETHSQTGSAIIRDQSRLADNRLADIQPINQEVMPDAHCWRFNPIDCLCGVAGAGFMAGSYLISGSSIPLQLWLCSFGAGITSLGITGNCLENCTPNDANEQLQTTNRENSPPPRWQCNACEAAIMAWSAEAILIASTSPLPQLIPLSTLSRFILTSGGGAACFSMSINYLLRIYDTPEAVQAPQISQAPQQQQIHRN